MKTMSWFEKLLWGFSVGMIVVSSLLTGSQNVLAVIASLIGVTALIFVAKGHVMGQILTVVFSLFYGWISVQYSYYGEMITYLFMTTPIAILSVVSWVRNPYEKGKNEVRVAELSKKQWMVLVMVTVMITGAFYFILKYLGTQNLVISTISIATSFLASSLMFLRNPAYALAYAANDIVLISLWILATFDEASYVSMVVCFVMFLCNDVYGYYNWRKMHQRQG